MTPELAAKLNAWQEQKKIAADSKALEMTLRKELFNKFFPNPEEGVNKLELQDGWGAKGTYKLDRKIDEAALPAVNDQLKELGVAFDGLVKNKPSLVIKEYKKLNEEHRAIFDEALTTKPGSPTLEITAPKAAK